MFKHENNAPVSVSCFHGQGLDVAPAACHHMMLGSCRTLASFILSSEAIELKGVRLTDPSARTGIDSRVGVEARHKAQHDAHGSSNMSDESCQRCGQRINGQPAILAIERDGIPLDGSPLSLCSHCVESYEHWLRRRRKHSRSARVESSAVTLEKPPRERPARRSGSRKSRVIAVRIIFLIVALLGSALLMAAVLRSLDQSRMAAADGGP